LRTKLEDLAKPSVAPWSFSGRRPADWLLFGVTAAELALLIHLTPTFTLTDWIYAGQHLVVLAIALSRRAPRVQDRSSRAAAAVAVSYAYPYAQMIFLRWVPGEEAWQKGGLVLVTLAACLSLASLFALGRFFGVRPALRGLVTNGPYRFVRHPMYLAYVLSDVGYTLQEWHPCTLLLVLCGWGSLVYRVVAEERMLEQDAGWAAYAARVRYRLLPGLW
jgi:protein-S-isoprenylcysteine O-methyltransferase Ste14